MRNSFPKLGGGSDFDGGVRQILILGASESVQ